MTQSTERGSVAHRVHVRLLLSYVVLMGLLGLAWAVTASMASTPRATYSHMVNVVDALSTNMESTGLPAWGAQISRWLAFRGYRGRTHLITTAYRLIQARGATTTHQ
jgi:hypothetical protein